GAPAREGVVDHALDVPVGVALEDAHWWSILGGESWMGGFGAARDAGFGRMG
ncbi:MAG: hypothetical protein ACI8PZ_007050, partial [Myxococcota bacterium]